MYNEKSDHALRIWYELMHKASIKVIILRACVCVVEI